jgi:hypothetical protein
MLKCYYYSYSSRGVPYYTTLPHGLILPLIKRARTLVKCVIVIVILVKIYYIYIVILVDAKLGGCEAYS